MKHIILVLWLLCVGIFYQVTAQVYDGWAFVSNGKKSYLVGVDKTIVHTWTSANTIVGAPRLCRDSSVYVPSMYTNGWSGGALTTGRFQRISWNGEVLWDFTYSSSTYCPHHNFDLVYKTDDPKEVPNILIACYQKVSGSTLNLDKVVEIKPTGKTTGEVVWVWDPWEHRTTTGTDHPEALDEAKSSKMMNDWIHLNSVSYNKKLDQVILGFKHYSELIIIDHSTTTAEASGTTGGKYGKGGSILYRWGMASNYGITGCDYLSGFHGACWVPDFFPGTTIPMPQKGKALIYWNGGKKVIEITLPGTGDGIYPRNAGEAFAPASPSWIYANSSAASNEGSVQALPNGNYFICNTGKTMFEVTPSGTTVWTMNIPTSDEHQGPSMGGTQALKFAYSYLSGISSVKGTTDLNGIRQKPFTVNSTQFSNVHRIIFADNTNALISIYSIDGKEVLSRYCNQKEFIWNSTNQANGVYFIKIMLRNNKDLRFVKIIR